MGWGCSAPKSQKHPGKEQVRVNACQAQTDLGSTHSTLTYKNSPVHLHFPCPTIPTNAKVVFFLNPQ